MTREAKQPLARSWGDRLLLLAATGLGLGWLPWAPGTVGTLLGLPLTWCLQLAFPLWGQLLVLAGLFAVGVPLCTGAQQLIGRKDPGSVVWDEIVTLPLVFIAVPLDSWQVGLVGFLLHRIFDISKLPPGRQLERLPAGWGIMADDVAAAAYGALALGGLRWLGWL